MNIENASMILAAIATVATIFWFLVIAIFHSPISDYYFADRGLDSSSIRGTLAATATSLAGAIFFFMLQTSAFGWIILIVPLATGVGYYLFIRIIKDSSPDPAYTGSIKRIINWKTGSSKLANICNILVAVNFLAVYLIEIIIGSTIFSYFIGGNILGLVFFSMFISAIVLFYVLKGGFSAVAFTDKWQFFLLSSGFIVTIFSLAYSFASSGHSLIELTNVFSTPKLPAKLQIIFLINLLVINATLPSSQITTWQRYSAAKSQPDAIKGFVKGILLGVVPIWLVAIVVSAILFVVSGGKTGFDGLFDFLRSNSLIGALLVFPLLFAGLVAALLSTADSFMNSTMLAVEDFFSNDNQDDKTKHISMRKRMFLTGGILALLGVLGSYGVASSTDINSIITKMLFAAYGIPCLLFPIVAYGWSKKFSETVNKKIITIGIVASLAILVGSAIYGIIKNDFAANMLGPVIAVACSFIGVLVSTYFERARVLVTTFFGEED